LILSTCAVLPAAARSLGGPLAAALASAAFLAALGCALAFDALPFRSSITLRKRGSDSGEAMGSERLATAGGVGPISRSRSGAMDRQRPSFGTHAAQPFPHPAWRPGNRGQEREATRARQHYESDHRSNCSGARLLRAKPLQRHARAGDVTSITASALPVL